MRFSFTALARFTASALAATTLTAIAPLVSAQGLELPQPSPKARVEQRVGVTDLVVDYSSPGVKGRPIWGALVPYDKPWRSGANAATKLIASRDFTFGGTAVPAGSYAVYTIPGKTSWTVILNSSSESWGTNGYDQKKDVARLTVKPETVPHRERMTFIFSRRPRSDGTRVLAPAVRVTQVGTNTHFAIFRSRQEQGEQVQYGP